MMGGDTAEHDMRAAASALGWWLEAGVDVIVQEEPRNWLAPAPPPKASAKIVREEQPAARAPLPETLDLFRDWLASSPEVPLAQPGARRVLPTGAEHAELMQIADLPTHEEEAAGTPIGCEGWRLTDRMLAAIGLHPEQAYWSAIA